MRQSVVSRLRLPALLMSWFAIACSPDSSPAGIDDGRVLRSDGIPEENPEWVRVPEVLPEGLRGQNNCLWPFGVAAVWDFHADAGCWERPGPDGWTRQQTHRIHVSANADCGGGAADVAPIRLCREGGAGQIAPCAFHPSTGPQGCAICVRSVTCH